LKFRILFSFGGYLGGDGDRQLVAVVFFIAQRWDADKCAALLLNQVLRRRICRKCAIVGFVRRAFSGERKFQFN
jgi:hypothetical protein